MLKEIKKALTLSMITLVLCLGMLIGTTYAWFTDSASSGGNVIQAGNLDVNMQWALGKEDPANAKWTSEGAIFNNTKWEPGYAEARHIKISNIGSLALKYQVVFEVKGEVSELAEVIDVYYVDPAVQVADRGSLSDQYKLGTLKEVLANLHLTASGKLLAGEADTITLVLKMQEGAGNEYEGKSIGESFTIKVVATQTNYEEDSFGPNYDAGSPWLGGVDTSWYNETDTEFVLYTAEELAGFAAITNGTNLEKLSDDFAGKTVKLGNSIDLNNLNWTPISDPMSDEANFAGFAGTFDGNGYTISNLNVNNQANWGQGLFGYNANKSTVIKNFKIKNVTVNAEEAAGAVAGYFSYGTFENVHVTGEVAIKGAQHMGGIVGNGYYVNISDCSVIANEGSYVYATKGSFAAGIVGYHGGGSKSILNCTVKNLDITAYGAVGTIAGIACTNITIKGCVAENVVLNKTSVKTNPSIGLVCGTWSGNNTNAVISNNTLKNITLNGTSKEYPHNIYLGSNYEGNTDAFKGTVENNTTTGIENNLVQGTIVENREELLEALKNGETVVLTEDIVVELEDAVSAPYGNKTAFIQNGGLFDGNGNTIGLNSFADHYVVMTTGGTIKNVTIASGFRGIMIMYPTEKIVIDNVTIKGEGCYTINTGETAAAGPQELVVTNSSINGWTSFGSAVKSASFTNCKFGQGQYYTNVYGRLVKPYVDTVFENCDFSSKYYIDLSALGENCKVVFKNCTVNGVKLTAENWATLVVAENDCVEGQISIEGKNGTYMTTSNVFDYVIFE